MSTRTAEVTALTSAETKERAMETYERWGLSLSDAINIFLVRSVEVGGLPFSMNDEPLPYAVLSSLARRVSVDASGAPVLPAEWDDDGD